MKISDKSVSFVGLGLVLAVASLSACGKKEKSDDKSVNAANSPLGDLRIEGLASFPDLSLMLKANPGAKSAALNLTRGASDAVNGTPPLAKDIKPANMEEFLTGSIDTFIAGVEAKKAAAMTANTKEAWDLVNAEVDKFRDAQSKCRVLQDTARQVSELSDNSNTMCYFSKIGTKGAGILIYKAGEKIAEEDFFKPDAEKDVVRKIVMGGEGGGRLTLDGDQGGPDQGGDKDGGGQTIVFEFPKAVGNNYKVKLSFCNAAGTAVKNVESIDVDSDKGILTLTGMRSEQDSVGSQKLTAGLKKGTDGK